MNDPEVPFEVLATGDYSALSRPILVAVRDHRALRDFRKLARISPADVICVACHKAKDLLPNNPRKVVILTEGWYENPDSVEFVKKWVESEGHTFANYAPSSESRHVSLSQDPWILRCTVQRKAAIGMSVVCLIALIVDSARGFPVCAWIVAMAGWLFGWAALPGCDRGDS
jgi:hypothetical protein